jgi:hypothetical protein
MLNAGRFPVVVEGTRAVPVSGIESAEGRVSVWKSSGVAVVVAIGLWGRSVLAQTEPKSDRFRIEGTWDLNIAKSEEPATRMWRGGPGGYGGGRGAYPGGRGGGGWGGRGGGGRPPEREPEGGAGEGAGRGQTGAAMATAYRLVFAQSDTMLVITVPGNSIRRIRLDQKESVDTTIDGRIVKLTTKLEESKLKVERETERGKVSETFDFDKDTGELVIRTKVSGPRGSMSFKRVYVRAKDQG